MDKKRWKFEFLNRALAGDGKNETSKLQSWIKEKGQLFLAVSGLCAKLAVASYLMYRHECGIHLLI